MKFADSHPRDEAWDVLTFSPDGRLLASSRIPRRTPVGIWDVQKGSLLRELPGGSAPSVAFSPDSTLLATGHWDNTARLWEMPSGNLKATLKGHVQPVHGRRLLAGWPDARDRR